nr:type II toxin-antitoxin system antitoxin SocA domain-containing protein [uncultured Anaerostipes sp.]
MYHALDIALYIIERCNGIKKSISNLKLQKILYFVQAEFLVTKNRPCFTEVIQAWDFGPVVPDVYYAYRMYGSANIPCVRESKVSRIISKKDRDTLNGIVDECSKYSASALVEITHNQTPWIEAYKTGRNNEITQESIKKFFKED